ncbi:hypothetical protein LOY42_09950 [Pseudomonas sp. B21-023]|uniref:hypothetical protein n=1 Tax=unclassified Pseudomonas TaxID=196821 RepID=UPI00111A8E05|nr:MULTISPECIES: hypothetical protein [unclassified Pseudomonas]UVL21191.1 hypothetical protein LOY44_09970 [Pseudomonas sp. B21-044]UVM18597.1 hypothetical protein LOY42_09950 [Pseudomonas sp. B21-023]
MTTNRILVSINESQETLSVTEKSWNQFNDFDFWAYGSENIEPRYVIQITGTLRQDYSIDPQAQDDVGRPVQIEFGQFGNESTSVTDGKLTVISADYKNHILEAKFSFARPDGKGEVVCDYMKVNF